MSVPCNTRFHFLTCSTVLRYARRETRHCFCATCMTLCRRLARATDVAPTLTGAKVAAESDQSIGCFVLASDGPGAPDMQDLIDFIRKDRGLNTPILLIREMGGVDQALMGLRASTPTPPAIASNSIPMS